MTRKATRLAYCAFEYVYFARPDSVIFDQSVSEVRKRFGRQLALELIDQRKIPPIDKVIPVLDSGGVSSFAFAQILLREKVKQMIIDKTSPDQVPDELFPFDFGLIRNHYSGRNFITPSQQAREQEVDLKHNVDRNVVAGKNIASGDDSIVRSTTAKRHAAKYKAAGAKKVSKLVFSPPIIASCYYGIDTKRHGELIASSKSIEEIRREIGVDFLYYLSLEGFKKCLGCPQDFCLACFTKEYPIPITD
jgi:amidophosphoribosyltransferase